MAKVIITIEDISDMGEEVDITWEVIGVTDEETSTLATKLAQEFLKFGVQKGK